MPGIRWAPEEIKSLINTLRRFTTVGEALLVHNKNWQVNRTINSVERKFRQTPGIRPSISYLKREKIKTPIDEKVKALINIIKKIPHISATDLCNRLKCSPSEVQEVIKAARLIGYAVSMPTNDHITLDTAFHQTDRHKIHRLPILPVKDLITFAVISDPHFASRLHRNECLKDFLNVAQEEGVKRIFMPGDIMAGINMYRGWLSEVKVATMEGQIQEVKESLPKLDGITYEMISGNHDESFRKSSGGTALKYLALQREDINHLGFYSAMVDLYPEGWNKGLKIELFHPEGAGSYALSYHIQKEIEQMPGGMKPHIFLCGHRHTSLWVPDYRGVAGFNCGTFEDQTLYLKRKKINPMIGGFIIKAGITKDGSFKTLLPMWVRYFHSRRGPIECGPGGEGGRFDRRIGAPVET